MDDRGFYRALVTAAPRWSLVERTIVAAGRGHGIRVAAGQAISFVMMEGAQIIDLDLFSASDPDEFLHAPTQLRSEGGRVRSGTPVWGTPPRSRPLATVIVDRIEHQGDPMLVDHKCYGAHCNPHQWLLFAGHTPATCYDNLSDGCRMVGLEPRRIHDNLNLYMKAALEPGTGRHRNVTSDARAGDYIQFYAETDLLFVFSLCPYGDGSVVPEDWATTPVPTSPIAVEIHETGVRPLDWPRATVAEEPDDAATGTPSR